MSESTFGSMITKFLLVHIVALEHHGSGGRDLGGPAGESRGVEGALGNHLPT